MIDAQVEYSCDGSLELPDLSRAIERIAELIAESRRLGTPIIHVLHRGSRGGLFDPNSGGLVIPAVNPDARERTVSKTLPNAFANTELAEHVESLGRPPLVLVGFMTHMCVSSTARAALDLGIATTVVSDATATRPLPAADGGESVSAADLQRCALAALADRFSIVTSTQTLIA